MAPGRAANRAFMIATTALIKARSKAIKQGTLCPDGCFPLFLGGRTQSQHAAQGGVGGQPGVCYCVRRDYLCIGSGSYWIDLPDLNRRIRMWATTGGATRMWQVPKPPPFGTPRKKRRGSRVVAADWGNQIAFDKLGDGLPATGEGGSRAPTDLESRMAPTLGQDHIELGADSPMFSGRPAQFMRQAQSWVAREVAYRRP